MTLSPPSALRRRLRVLGLATCSVLVVLLGAALWAWLRFQGSLPQLDGTASLPGLSAAVTVERDSLGVPTLRGRSRPDLARALGYVHGQDRFFQMDLSRRRSAGELAALFGPAALPLDRGARLHEFRALSRRVLDRLAPEERALLEAYAAGVNAALAAFTHRPWEYDVLRRSPEPWKPEDTVLCVYSMALDLQDENGVLERTLLVLRDTYGSDMVAFFAPTLGPDDAAIDGSAAPLPPIPSARWIDLRRTAAPTAGTPTASAPLTPAYPAPEDLIAYGSNSFGLAGRAGGPALLQNDMHLGLGVPPVWYRARLIWTDVVTGTSHDVVGVTLPGAPAVVVGSNGAVAWGFTNSNTDAGDLVLVQPDSALPDTLYTLGTRPVEFEERKHTIEVKGGAPETLAVRWTAWGPVVGENREKKPLAHRWTMHDPDAVNFRLLRLETSRNVSEALAVMHEAGIPPQNALVADRHGDLAWTIAGRLPRRVGFDGRLPISWAFGDRGWRGFLDPAEIPVRRVGDGAPLWTANQRIVGGPDLALLGNGGYDMPYRAGRIRDLVTALAGREPTRAPTPKDLLEVALDERNLLLDRWQRLLQATLASEPDLGEGRSELRRLTAEWEGRATTDSVAYAVVRAWRLQVAARALTPLFAPCAEAWPGFNFRTLPYEHALWALLEQRPAHFLPADYRRWEDLLLAAADDVIAGATREHGSLAAATWGSRNTVRLRHPFSRALPAWLAAFIDLPPQQLPGDGNTPRVQSRSDGASQRMAVAPGKESEALFHMPAGQSGHPLSPYYRAGHAAWAAGEPTPLLPGAAAHTLTLAP